MYYKFQVCFMPKKCQLIKTHLILTCFALLRFTDVACLGVSFLFYKLKGKLFTSKRIKTCFTVSFALLWWSGNEAAISPRYFHMCHVKGLM